MNGPGARIMIGRAARSMGGPTLVLTAALALALAAPRPLAAQEAGGAPGDPSGALSQVERDLAASSKRDAELKREAERVEAELASLRAQILAMAQKARAAELELNELERKLADLEKQERAHTAGLDADRQRIGTLLAAAQRISRIPPEALLIRPEPTVEAVRGTMLLGATIPELQQRMASLRAALDQQAHLRASIEERRTRIKETRAELDRETAAMRTLIAKREAVHQKTDEERRRIVQRTDRLAGEAKDLRGLIEKLESERLQRDEEDRRRAEAAATRSDGKRTAGVRPPPERDDLPAGRMILPVAGNVATRYGEPDRFGNPSRGLVLTTRPGATVVAPLNGSIAFAGPFRGYGLILIVEHGNGYHSLIAGLGRIETRVGQQVLAGEPVGVMAPGSGSPELYFELRRHGQPINPQRNLAADGKGQG